MGNNLQSFMWQVPRLVAGALMLTVIAGCSGGDEEAEPQRIPVRSVTQSPETLAAGDPGALPATEVNWLWTQFGGSAAGGGFHPAFAGEFVLKWRFNTGASVNSDWPFTAEPLVVDDFVILLDADLELWAINAETGSAVWRTDLLPEGESRGDGFGGGLGYSQNRVYAATGYGEVLSINAIDGEVVWRVQLGAPVRSAPVILDGFVAVVPRDDRVRVLDIETGEEQWSELGAGAPANFLHAASPAARDGVLAVPFASGELTAFSLTEGESQWSEVLAGAFRDSPLAAFSDVTASPIMGEQYVYAGTRRGEFAAIDWRTGSVGWRRPIGAADAAWLVGDSVYLIDIDANLMRLSTADGGTFWRQPLPAYEDPDDREDPILYAGPVVAGGHVLLVSSEGELLVFDPETGESIDQLDVGDPSSAAPVVAGNTVYLFLDDGALLAIR